MLLEKAITGFNNHLLSKERAKTTIRGYNLSLQDFRRYIEKRLNGQVYVEEVTFDHLEAYLDYRKDCGDQPISRNRTLYIFRSFYTYLINRDFVEKDISLKLEPINIQHKERTYLLPEEVETLLAAIEHAIIKTAATTLAYTGLRVSELCNLTLDDVNFNTECIQVRHGKGNKDRMVPMNPKLKVILVNYLKTIRPTTESEKFFATQKTGALSDQSINRYLKLTTKQLGWTKHVTAHILRHSFASTLVRNNAPLPAVQNLLGHSDLRVTSRYIHQDLGQLQAAVNLM